MQLAFRRIVSQGLNDADRESIFRAIENENVFVSQTALILLPLEELFDFRVFDRGDALVVIEEPFDHVRH